MESGTVKSVMKQKVSNKVAGGVIVLTVLITLGILYWKVIYIPKSPAFEGDQGMMEMAGPGGGMARQPSPRRNLRNLVRKLAVLYKQDPSAISAEQSTALLPLLVALQEPEKMTEEDAEKSQATLEKCLTEAQMETLAGIELPRRSWGGSRAGSTPGAGAEAQAPAATEEATAAAPQAPPSTEEATAAAPQTASREDRRSAWRKELLENPAVKQAYDEKLAADPALADDQELQRAFFRSVMRELNPFHQGTAKEALDELLTALQGKTGPE